MSDNPSESGVGSALQRPTSGGRDPQAWVTLRSEFPITGSYAYLDNATLCPPPRFVSDKISEFLTDMGKQGTTQYATRVLKKLFQFRLLAARLLETVPERITVLRSTSQGLGLVATGLVCRAGDNVVLGADEFPANLRPWLALERAGVELRFVRHLHGRLNVDDLMQAMDGRTAAVSVSFVQYLSGFRLDLAALADRCRATGALCVVDAIQGLGVFPLAVERLGVDVVAAGAHKWLMGCEGVGIGYFSPRALARIQPALQGWLSVKDPWDLTDPRQPLKEHADRFEEGTYNWAGIVGIVASLNVILRLGIPAIQARVLQLTATLLEGLRKRDWDVLSPHDSENQRSGIVLARHRRIDPAVLQRRLGLAGVVVALRSGSLRISPHIYNDEEDLHRFFAVCDGLTD